MSSEVNYKKALNMKISEMPEYRDRDEVLAMPANSTVVSAAKEMKKRNYGAVVITSKNKVKGIQA